MNEMYIYKPETGEQTAINKNSCGIDFLKHDISSPEVETDYINLEGHDGVIDSEGTFESRKITCYFITQARNLHDFYLQQQKIFGLIFERWGYYIRFKRMPGIQYMVKPLPFDIRKVNFKTGEFQIEFTAFKGYGESIGTSLAPFTTDSELWQTGQGLLGTEFEYSFSTNRFKVFNAGDFNINPNFHQLLITITGSSENGLQTEAFASNTGGLQLYNLTTGDRFIYYPALKEGEVLTIDRVYPKLNGVNCGRSTNHELLSLRKGWNTIEILNANRLNVSFDFPFLYK
ncbi:phage tail family protein [Listeria booriae]|uniref:Phage tail family protein n=1 Tax=Listeria booriae TaxID=1552123 RepID=A0A842ABV2_9LIST|nr:phage tail family protein [Listeria booriae]MBC1615303.1 phage tail family protein [Listeria booriae]